MAERAPAVDRKTSDPASAPADADPVATEAPGPDAATAEPAPDRWRWRAKIRANPHTRLWYRVGVAVVGGLLLILAAVTGPLPGPGGIPLALAGLAVWASEFHWAHRITRWFHAAVNWYHSWSKTVRVLFWIGLVLLILGIWYVVLLTTGIPGWVPGPVHNFLTGLPGVTGS